MANKKPEDTGGSYDRDLHSSKRTGMKTCDLGI